MKRFMVLDVESFLRTDTKWVAPESDANAFAPIPCHGIASIGGLVIEISDKFNRCTFIGTFGESGDESHERSRIEAFLKFYRKDEPVIVTYNGRGFDIPVIWHRAMHHGIQTPEFFAKDFVYRYSQIEHFDIADKMCEYGAFHRSKLDLVCEVVGLPGKTGIDGSQVHGLFRAGEYSKIDSYVQCDVIEEAYLFLKYLHVRGDISTTLLNNIIYSIKSKAIEKNDATITNLINNINFSVMEASYSKVPVQIEASIEANEEAEDGIPF